MDLAVSGQQVEDQYMVARVQFLLKIQIMDVLKWLIYLIVQIKKLNVIKNLDNVNVLVGECVFLQVKKQSQGVHVKVILLFNHHSY
jgi:hypothetical protein